MQVRAKEERDGPGEQGEGPGAAAFVRTLHGQGVPEPCRTST